MTQKQKQLAHDAVASFQQMVGEWSDNTFKRATLSSITSHLKREAQELNESDDALEAADCFLLLCHHAHRSGYNILEKALEKHEINKARQWGEPDHEGVVSHVK